MGYTHSCHWKTAIADASRCAAWSRDVAHLQRYMATQGRLLPWEFRVTGTWYPGGFELMLDLSPHEEALQRSWRNAYWPELQPFDPVVIGFDDIGDPIFVVPSPKPLPFKALLIRGPDGTGEPIFTPTEVAFNGDRNTRDSLQEFRITFHDLQAPFCKYRWPFVDTYLKMRRHFLFGAMMMTSKRPFVPISAFRFIRPPKE